MRLLENSYRIGVVIFRHFILLSIETLGPTWRAEIGYTGKLL